MKKQQGKKGRPVAAPAVTDGQRRELCCDEKTQCQALERTQPALPLKTGRAKTFTHD